MSEHPAKYGLKHVDISGVLNEPTDAIALAASQLETAARILRRQRTNRLDSATWRLADALRELGDMGDDLPGVHRPTRMGARLAPHGAVPRFELHPIGELLDWPSTELDEPAEMLRIVAEIAEGLAQGTADKALAKSAIWRAVDAVMLLAKSVEPTGRGAKVIVSGGKP